MDDEEWFDDAEFDREEEYKRYDQIEESRSDMVDRYNDNKSSNIGTTIRCPYCKKRIIKKYYNTMFCSNAKTSGKNNCKDKYWNFASQKRCERATKYMNKDNLWKRIQ